MPSGVVFISRKLSANNNQGQKRHHSKTVFNQTPNQKHYEFSFIDIVVLFKAKQQIATVKLRICSRVTRVELKLRKMWLCQTR